MYSTQWSRHSLIILLEKIISYKIQDNIKVKNAPSSKLKNLTNIPHSEVHNNTPFQILFPSILGETQSSPRFRLNCSVLSVGRLTCCCGLFEDFASLFFWSLRGNIRTRLVHKTLLCFDAVLRFTPENKRKSQTKRSRHNFRFRFYQKINCCTRVYCSPFGIIRPLSLTVLPWDSPFWGQSHGLTMRYKNLTVNRLTSRWNTPSLNIFILPGKFDFLAPILQKSTALRHICPLIIM